MWVLFKVFQKQATSTPGVSECIAVLVKGKGLIVDITSQRVFIQQVPEIC